MAFGVSDDVLGIFASTIVYWLYSGIFVLLGPMEKHRLFTKEEEETKNLVTKGEVVRGVLLEQALQIVTFSIVVYATKETTPPAAAAAATSLVAVGRQLVVALLVLDAWQYWWHRLFHLNTFMYKHVHAQHHRLVVPYAFGALYNHPLEGFILDTVGGIVSFLLSGMSPRTSIFFFALSTVKTIDDHCGLWFPGHPFHRWFHNNSAFHAVHHQLYGGKFNFSAPFLVMWDKLMGTYLPYAVEERKGGDGYEIRPLKSD